MIKLSVFMLTAIIQLVMVLSLKRSDASGDDAHHFFVHFASRGKEYMFKIQKVTSFKKQTIH